MSKIENLAQYYLGTASELINKKTDNAINHHYDVLRLLSKQRLNIIKSYIIEKHGLKLSYGPFQGMQFISDAADGCFIPKLIGFYEAELHPTWYKLQSSRRYETIIDIGAAEGYYAVGMARLFPKATIYAHDTNHLTHEHIEKMIKLNAVTAQVSINGEFKHTDFQKYERTPTLVICDIEGAEKDLLDPILAHALLCMDIVVETHPGVHPDILGILIKRFSSTHNIEIFYEQTPRHIQLPDYFKSMDRLDQLLAIWEFRQGPTPWLVMTAKSFPTITVSYTP